MKLLLPLKAAALLSLFAIRAFGQAAAPPAPAGRTLEFIENKGQWDAHVRYVAPLPGGRLFAEAHGLTFSLLAEGGPARWGHGGPHPAAHGPVRGHALTLHFEGASPAALTAETPTAEHRNYFLGRDPQRWASDVRGFRELRYAGLWPGVDARVYESADQHLEYDFELAPGARPEAIGLRHDGADGLALDAAGNLLVQTSVATLVEQAPRAWQTGADGQRRAVACRYVLAGPVAHFALGQYDHARPLTIDPVVVFASYSGATVDNWGFTATYDGQGNLYSGGIAFGPGYPVTLGAFQTGFADLIDIALIKYRPQANGPAARVWATYIGGDGAEFPHSMVVNSQGELLVLGSSGSGNYPVTANALQRDFAGGRPTAPFGGFGPPYDVPTGSDLVITRLNANGSDLVASTYLGGSGNDGLLPLNDQLSAFALNPQLAHNYGDSFRGDILVDAADNVYIASSTASRDFPLARGFADTYRGGASDGVVCKLTPNLAALTWGSYLGGGGSDAAYSLQLAPGSGDVYVAGGTLSANFPATPGAYRTLRPGNVDGFAARIAANGMSLLRATYVGTAAYDQSYFLQLGTDGGVYLLGQTRGAFPVTPGLFGTPNGTQFIQKLDPDLGQSQLATVFGSTDPLNNGLVALSPTAFLVDRCDRVYVCGWGGQVNGRLTDSLSSYPYLYGNGRTTGLPTTPDALQTATDGSDFYLAQFSAGLTALDYATYYGNTDPSSEGEHVDGGTSRFDPRGIVYQAVCSCILPTGFPIPPGANTYSTTNNSGNCNNAAFVFNFQPNIANAGADQTVCATAGPQPLAGSPGGGVWSGPGVTGSPVTGFVFTPTLALLGTQVLTYTVLATGLCTTTDTRRVTVAAPLPVVFAPLLQATYCLSATEVPAAVPLRATPAGGTFSGPGVSSSLASGYVFSPGQVAGTVQLTYTVNLNGCEVRATQAATVSRLPVPAAGADTVVCAGSTQPFALRGSPAGGTFSGPGVSGSAATGFVFTPPAGFTGSVSLAYTAANGNCVGTATRRVSAAVPPPLLPSWAPVACPETRLAPLTLRFALAGAGPGAVVWDFGDGTQSTEISPLHTYPAAGTFQPRVRVRYNQGQCEAVATAPPVEVRARKVPNIITPNGDGLNQAFRLGPDCPVRLQVFSRWGQLVFEAAAYRDNWSAEGQPDGTYYYLITYPDGSRLKGWVEVVR